MAKLSIKHAAALLGVSIAVGVAYAKPDDVLLYVKGQGAPTTVALTPSTKITFDSNTLIASTSDGKISLDIADIDRIEFDLKTSSEEEIEAPLSEDITINIYGKNVSVSSASGANVDLKVYDTAGHQIANHVGEGNVEVDFNDKKAGVYIIVCGDKTIKYLNK